MKTKQLPQEWKEVELGDEEYFEINPKKSELIDIPENTKITFLGMENVGENGEIFNKKIKTLKEVIKGYTYFRKNDVLFAKITPCMENGKGTIAEINTEIGFGSTEFHIIRAKKQVFPKLIFFFLSSKNIRKSAEKNMTGSAGQKRVPLSFLKTLKIPLPFLNSKPDLETQKKIVEILEKAEQLKEKRKQTIKYLDDYLKSVFNEMFLKKKFKDKNLREIAILDMGGTPNTQINNYWENGDINWMKSGDIKGDFIVNVSNKITKEGLKNSNAKMYKIEDVVIALNGQGKTRASTAILKVETSSNQSVASISSDKNFLHPYYLHYNLKSRYQELRNMTGDEQRSGLNLTILRNLKIPLPPLPLQQTFASIVEHVEKLKEKQKQFQEEIGVLFNSLMQKAFKGELVA